MKISRNSWHYCFMSTMGQDPEKRTDICSYWSGFVWALLLAVILAFVAFVVLIAFPVAAGSDIFYTETAFDDLTWLQLFVSWAVGISLYAFVVVFIIVLAFVSEVRTSTKNGEPSLFAAKWRSFKTKTCTKVDFE